MNNYQNNQNGPEDAPTSKGPNAKAVEASASILGYTEPAAGDKQKAPSTTPDNRTHRVRGRSCAKMPVGGTDGPDLPKAAYSDSAGRKWAYRGKRARVLVMLANTPGGVTQWDTLPWHTRLGGTIHAMREDGLSISTELEGDYRHARYRLVTPGSLIIQPGNRQGSVLKHRVAP